MRPKPEPEAQENQLGKIHFKVNGQAEEVQI